jgi:ubiquinone/menaquinone biosynthesis C-methylase UbiE
MHAFEAIRRGAYMWFIYTFCVIITPTNEITFVRLIPGIYKGERAFRSLLSKTIMSSKDNWSATNYEKHASFVPKLGNIILDMLNAQSTEHVLDFGCGDGVLTRVLATRAQKITGIDASAKMIEKANQEKPDNVTFHTVNGYDLDTWFDQQKKQEPFDAVFSSATLHWLKEDPSKAIRNIHHVLKSGGRFVAEFGGFMNVGGKYLSIAETYKQHKTLIYVKKKKKKKKKQRFIPHSLLLLINEVMTAKLHLLGSFHLLNITRNCFVKMDLMWIESSWCLA